MRPVSAELSGTSLFRPSIAGDEAVAPVERLIGLATSFEITLAGLNMQIALETGEPPTPADILRAGSFATRIVAFRQKVRALVGTELMPDSGFDVLLEIFSMQVRGQRMSVTDVCAGLDIPHTNTRRWLQKLHVAGLVDRREDADDHRREWVSLTPPIVDAIRLMLGPFS